MSQQIHSRKNQTMGFRQSYFALGELHPMSVIEHLLHPYRPLA